MKTFVKASQLKAFHFFASSVGEWRIDTDIRRLMQSMDRSRLKYGIWFIPHDRSTKYEIRSYQPVIDGAVFLGKYQPE